MWHSENTYSLAGSLVYVAAANVGTCVGIAGACLSPLAGWLR